MRALSSLDVSDLACVRGEIPVFEGVTFSVASGRAFAVEGPNGSGKTSLLRILAGLLAPAHGTIRVDGHSSADSEDRDRLCAWLGHLDGIKAQLTVGENARFFAALHGASVAGVEPALARVGLTRLKDAPAQYLSAGQRRRLALARLVLVGRPLWLLDEPLAALDAAGRALVTELVQHHCAAGGIVIAATHERLGIEMTQVHLAGEALHAAGLHKEPS